MKVSSTSDIELWRMTSDTWSVPLYCRRAKAEEKDVWIVSPAVFPVSKRIDEVVTQTLKRNSIASAGDQYLIPYDKFSSTDMAMVKCPGITPSHYFWEDPSESIKTPRMSSMRDPLEAPEYNDEFIKKCWRRSALSDYTTYKVIWNSIIQEIGHYLIHENKPVDLGWFVVGAVPYRANWKQNIMAKHPQVRADVKHFKKSGEFRDKAHEIMNSLYCADMMALNELKKGEYTYSWTVEVIPKKVWHEYTQRTEAERKRANPGTTYIQIWGAILKSMWPFTYKCLSRFVEETSKPAGSLAAVRSGQHRRLVPYVPDTQIRPEFVDYGPFHLVTPMDHHEIHDPEGGPPLPISDPYVPQKVRTVRPKDGVMRIPRRSLGY